MNKRRYYPQLDSIRGLAFLAIFIYHSASIPEGIYLEKFLNYIHIGLLRALDVFFILSAFLLTSLALNEYKEKQRFSLRNYFKRRILRIWPLYYLIMIFSYVLLPIIGRLFNIRISLISPGWYLFFVSNFNHAAHVYFLAFLWTLSVEEQFYLVLGFSLRFLSKHMLIVFLLFIAISIIFSLYFIVSGGSYDERNTIFFLIDFGLGGIAALAFFREGKIVQLLSNFKKGESFLFYIYVPVHFIAFYFINGKYSSNKNTVFNLMERYLFIIYIGLLLIEQVVNKNKTEFLARNKLLIFTGKISFGLYCFHGIALTFVYYLFPCSGCARNFILTLGITYSIATISYYYFELPFLKLKTR